MRKITIVFILLSLIGRTFSVKSQSLHTPAQILDIMARSSINYTIDSLGQFSKVKSGHVLSRQDLNVLLSVNRSLPLGTSPKGVGFLNQGDCIKAVKLLVKKSNDYISLSMANQLDLCDCLQREGEWESSIKILKGLQNEYPRHFEIPRKLSAAYVATNREALAYTQIQKAWILNRNHPLIQNEVQRISESMNNEFSRWEWLPKVEVTSMSDGVSVSFRKPNLWLAYGLCEAVWAYEPNYSAQMKTLLDADLENVQATECLMNAIITYASDIEKERTLPEMEALNRAVENQLTEAFILFEIRLPNNPGLVLQLEEAQLVSIATYLDTCR